MTRPPMQHHVTPRPCPRCAAVLDGAQNMVGSKRKPPVEGEVPR